MSEWNLLLEPSWWKLGLVCDKQRKLPRGFLYKVCLSVLVCKYSQCEFAIIHCLLVVKINTHFKPGLGKKQPDTKATFTRSTGYRNQATSIFMQVTNSDAMPQFPTFVKNNPEIGLWLCIIIIIAFTISVVMMNEVTELVWCFEYGR